MKAVKTALTLCVCFVASAVASAKSAPALPPAKDMLFWTPSQQAIGFKSMSQIYASKRVRHGQDVLALPKDHEIKVAYEDVGGVKSTDDFLKDNYVFGLLILRHGRIVMERYRNGFTPSDRWTSFSMSKSMTSTLVGAAIKDGKIASVDDLVTKYLPQLQKSGYEGVTVRQVLNMSSGVKWNEDYLDRSSDTNFIVNTLAERRSGALLAHEQQLPRAWAPDSKFDYNSGNTHVLGAVVAAATGVELAEYLSEKIWKPAGMESDAFWTADGDQGVVFAGCCVNATLRDFARFGLFFLHNGERDGKSILPAGWVAEATAGSAASSTYSFQWWLNPQLHAFSALGVFGQSITIVPSSDAVIAMVSAFPTPVPKAEQERLDRFLKGVIGTLGR